MKVDMDFNLEITRLDNFMDTLAYRYAKDKHSAEDLKQETIFRALKNKHQFKTNQNFKGWLSIIMRNQFINTYRKNKRFQKQEVENMAFFDTIASVRSEGVSKLNLEALNECIDDLPDRYRIIIRMLIDGAEYQEISDALEIPLGTTKSRIFHGRKILKRKLVLKGLINQGK